MIDALQYSVIVDTRESVIPPRCRTARIVPTKTTYFGFIKTCSNEDAPIVAKVRHRGIKNKTNNTTVFRFFEGNFYVEVYDRDPMLYSKQRQLFLTASSANEYSLSYLQWVENKVAWEKKQLLVDGEWYRQCSEPSYEIERRDREFCLTVSCSQETPSVMMFPAKFFSEVKKAMREGLDFGYGIRVNAIINIINPDVFTRKPFVPSSYPGSKKESLIQFIQDNITNNSPDYSVKTRIEEFFAERKIWFRDNTVLGREV